MGRIASSPYTSGPWAPDPQAVAQQQVVDLYNNTNQFGLNGNVTTATGQYYETGGAAGGSRSGSRTGTGAGRAPGAATDINLQDLWQKTGQIAPPPPPAPMPARVSPPNPADRAAAERATYGAAKDRIGLETRGALKSLGNAMSTRNMGASTFAARGIGDILQRGQMELGDTDRRMAIDALDRAGAVEDRNYAGDLSQRGQDISYTNEINASNSAAYAARRALLERLIAIQMDGGRIY